MPDDDDDDDDVFFPFAFLSVVSLYFSFSFVLKCILLSFNVMLLLIYFILLLFVSYISAVCVRFEAPFNSFTLPLILLSC